MNKRKRLDCRKWSTGKTTSIRVPVYMTKRLLKIAHYLDDNDPDGTNQLCVVFTTDTRKEIGF
jgi:hypothetical protein